MTPELKAAWVADLRTNPKQIQGQLAQDGGHCCLGRLCVVAGYEITDYGTGVKGHGKEGYEVFDSLLGESKANDLVYMNDVAHKTFAEIADWIEANV